MNDCGDRVSWTGDLEDPGELARQTEDNWHTADRYRFCRPPPSIDSGLELVGAEGFEPRPKADSAPLVVL